MRRPKKEGNYKYSGHVRRARITVACYRRDVWLIAGHSHYSGGVSSLGGFCSQKKKVRTHVVSPLV